MKLLFICILMLLSINIIAFEGQPKEGILFTGDFSSTQFVMEEIDVNDLLVIHCSSKAPNYNLSVLGNISFKAKHPYFLTIGDREYQLHAIHAKTYYSLAHFPELPPACSFDIVLDNLDLQYVDKLGNKITLTFDYNSVYEDKSLIKFKSREQVIDGEISEFY